MTTFRLLAYICSVLSLQLVVGAALGFMQYRRKRGEVVATHTEDAEPPTLAADLAWAGWRDFRVVRREFEDAAQSQCSFYLQPVDAVPLAAFRPGQYLTFLLPPAAGGVSRLTRCYSLSDRPDPEGYRITVKRVPAPAGRPDLAAGLSSNHFHDHVQVGDVLALRAPSGHFHLDEDATVPAVMVAGGIGITPMISMLRWSVAKQAGRVLHLYYGVRNGAEHAFKQTLVALAEQHPNLHLHVVYSQPGPQDVLGRDHHLVGHVDLALLRQTLPHGRHQFYLCGPGAMMQSLVPALREWGVQEADLHYEAFGPASVRPVTRVSDGPVVAGEAGHQVRFRRSGRTLTWDGQDANLLDFAERHGLVVDCGCRSGSCGACETRLLAGAVHYDQAPDHDVRAGHCLLCVGRPRLAIELEA